MNIDRNLRSQEAKDLVTATMQEAVTTCGTTG